VLKDSTIAQALQAPSGAPDTPSARMPLAAGGAAPSHRRLRATSPQPPSPPIPPSAPFPPQPPALNHTALQEQQKQLDRPVQGAVLGGASLPAPAFGRVHLKLLLNFTTTDNSSVALPQRRDVYVVLYDLKASPLSLGYIMCNFTVPYELAVRGMCRGGGGVGGGGVGGRGAAG
jgi:hypothetical protein